MKESSWVHSSQSTSRVRSRCSSKKIFAASTTSGFPAHNGAVQAPPFAIILRPPARHTTPLTWHPPRELQFAFGQLSLALNGAPLRVTPMRGSAAISMQAGTEGGIQTTGEGNAAEAGNYRRLSDALEEADVERRIELEAIAAREEAVERARAERLRKVALLTDIPDETKAGTVEDFMYKQGV